MIKNREHPMRSVRNAPKRAINLSLNSKVLDLAREMDINISQTVDAWLTEEVLRQYWARWPEENAQAIAEYNARIEREGTFAQSISRYLAQEPDQSSGKAPVASAR
jgi:antitoxin CcdA